MQITNNNNNQTLFHKNRFLTNYKLYSKTTEGAINECSKCKIASTN
jgi:hypothetical protein